MIEFFLSLLSVFLSRLTHHTLLQAIHTFIMGVTRFLGSNEFRKVLGKAYLADFLEVCQRILKSSSMYFLAPMPHAVIHQATTATPILFQQLPLLLLLQQLLIALLVLSRPTWEVSSLTASL